MKQTEVFLWYLKRIRFTFSKMVTEMDEIVCDAVIDCEKGSITNEQLNIIRGMADYLERATIEEENKL